jgi:hypothetical protein
MRTASKPLFAALFASGVALGMMSSARADDDALVARGAYLAKAGDCIACHSAPRGKPLAGRLPMMKPVGAI